MVWSERGDVRAGGARIGKQLVQRGGVDDAQELLQHAVLPLVQRRPLPLLRPPTSQRRGAGRVRRGRSPTPLQLPNPQVQPVLEANVLAHQPPERVAPAHVEHVADVGALRRVERDGQPVQVAEAVGQQVGELRVVVRERERRHHGVLQLPQRGELAQDCSVQPPCVAVRPRRQRLALEPVDETVGRGDAPGLREEGKNAPSAEAAHQIHVLQVVTPVASGQLRSRTHVKRHLGSNHQGEQLEQPLLPPRAAGRDALCFARGPLHLNRGVVPKPLPQQTGPGARAGLPLPAGEGVVRGDHQTHLVTPAVATARGLVVNLALPERAQQALQPQVVHQVEVPVLQARVQVIVGQELPAHRPAPQQERVHADRAGRRGVAAEELARPRREVPVVRLLAPEVDPARRGEAGDVAAGAHAVAQVHVVVELRHVVAPVPDAAARGDGDAELPDALVDGAVGAGLQQPVEVVLHQAVESVHRALDPDVPANALGDANELHHVGHHAGGRDDAERPGRAPGHWGGQVDHVKFAKQRHDAQEVGDHEPAGGEGKPNVGRCLVKTAQALHLHVVHLGEQPRQRDVTRHLRPSLHAHDAPSAVVFHDFAGVYGRRAAAAKEEVQQQAPLLYGGHVLEQQQVARRVARDVVVLPVGRLQADFEGAIVRLGDQADGGALTVLRGPGALSGRVVHRRGGRRRPCHRRTRPRPDVQHQVHVLAQLVVQRERRRVERLHRLALCSHVFEHPLRVEVPGHCGAVGRAVKLLDEEPRALQRPQRLIQLGRAEVLRRFAALRRRDAAEDAGERAFHVSVHCVDQPPLVAVRSEEVRPGVLHEPSLELHADGALVQRHPIAVHSEDVRPGALHEPSLELHADGALFRRHPVAVLSLVRYEGEAHRRGGLPGTDGQLK
ncbi:conjugative transfer protein Ti, putative [Babesia caballi]|uniref:Conjugative transfer protein Ti, putative n=1 Tax=Babesia caballi TaxID=5871 RepID=A0AAV4LLF3_BABCB|nr:conjugative transfer protein Ti, putative [Babesia caballi]